MAPDESKLRPPRRGVVAEFRTARHDTPGKARGERKTGRGRAGERQIKPTRLSANDREGRVSRYRWERASVGEAKPEAGTASEPVHLSSSPKNLTGRRARQNQTAEFRFYGFTRVAEYSAQS